MATGNSKITLRLGTGFGLLLVLMAGVIVVGSTRLGQVGQINQRLIEKNWANAAATNTVAATTAANAHEAMELIIAPDKERFAKTSGRIAANKKAVDDALATLERLLYTDEGKASLEQIKLQRARYIASINQVSELNAGGKRDEATRVMLGTALPALTALQVSIRGLSELQDRIAKTSGSDAQREIDLAYRWMAALGLLALALGAGCVYWIRRALICPLACCER